MSDRYNEYFDEQGNPYPICRHHIHKRDGHGDKFDAFVKTGGCCAYCGVKLLSWHNGMKDIHPKMHLDHVYPKARGGLDIDTNYMPSCSTCNLKKSTLTIDDFREVLFCDSEKGFSEIRAFSPEDDGTFYAEALGFIFYDDDEYSVGYDPCGIIYHIISFDYSGSIPEHLMRNPYFGETYVQVKNFRPDNLKLRLVDE